MRTNIALYEKDVIKILTGLSGFLICDLSKYSLRSAAIVWDFPVPGGPNIAEIV